MGGEKQTNKKHLKIIFLIQAIDNFLVAGNSDRDI